MLPRLANSVSRSVAKTSSVRPTIQKRFFGDPHADNGAEAVEALKIWKYVSVITLVPSTFAFLYYNFLEEHEHPLDLPHMPYKGVIIKKFPWGDGTLSLFAMMNKNKEAHHEHEH
jgi:hypothetical protein